MFQVQPRPSFGPRSLGHESRAVNPARPHAARGLARRPAMLPEPADALPDLPAPGESLHLLLDRRWQMAAVIASNCRHRGPVAHLRLASLSIGTQQVRTLAELADAGTVKKISLVLSDYFERMNAPVTAAVRSEFAARGFRLAFPACHAKVSCFEFADGSTFCIEGSANLRASKNFEQIAVVNDRGLHDFHAGWIDTVIDQYAQA